MPPIRLTDAELDAVMDAARPLPVESRDAFLQAVAAALRGCREWPHWPDLGRKDQSRWR